MLNPAQLTMHMLNKSAQLADNKDQTNQIDTDQNFSKSYLRRYLLSGEKYTQAYFQYPFKK